MSKFKKLIMSLLAVAMIGCMGTSVFAAIPLQQNEQETLIMDHFNKINTGDWDQWNCNMHQH